MGKRGISKSKLDAEDRTVDLLDMQRVAGKDIKKLLRIIRRSDYCTSLPKQHEAALVARGIKMKLQMSNLAGYCMAGLTEQFGELLDNIDKRYSGVIERAPLSVEISGALDMQHGGTINVISSIPNPDPLPDGC